ncbi:MAG: hypothetical protein Q7K40_04690 [bacterium]|nr:hypothetical protein [bacterium]
MIAFDRQERGKESELSAVQEFQKNYGIPVQAVATFEDLIDLLKNSTAGSKYDLRGDILEKILAYQKEYGV